MNVAIVAASGYIGQMLVKLLAAHPKARLACVTSRDKAGQAVGDALPSLRGKLGALKFDRSHPAELAARDDIDCFFLAAPHGAATDYARALIDAGKRVIDLSADFRLSDPSLYEAYYGRAHPDLELLSRSRYVLPEIAPEGWQSAPLIACPGCYPTSLLAPLFPPLRDGVIGPRGIVANSISGASGAGKKVHEDYLYCEIDESLCAYGIPKHRHLSEIEEQLGLAGQGEAIVQFSPHLAPLKQGIVSTIVVPAGDSELDDLYAAWETVYAKRPFVGILPPNMRPSSGHVVDSNRVDLSAVKDERTGNFVITSALDNLVKGASGQAVQIMNLWYGWSETEGLLHAL